MNNIVKLKPKKGYSFNKVVLFLTLSDVFAWGPAIVISTLAGLYLSFKLGEDAVRFIGIGVAIFYLTCASLQIPVGMFTDRIKKDRDEILLLFTGVIFMGVPFLFYPSISSSWMFYFLQFIHGAGAAINLVNWRKLFAKNLNKDREGFEYGSYETVMSLATGAFSAIAGVIANLGQHYFDLVMYSVGVIIVTSGFWVLLIFTVRRNSE